MNYIEFNGTKIPLKEIDNYLPKSSSEEYIKSFIIDWLNNKEDFQFHTSGSTGKPKPITLTRQQLTLSAEKTIQCLGLKSHSNCLLCIKPEFIGGAMMLVRALINEMNIIYTEASSDPLRGIESEIDFAAMVPLQVSTLLENHPNKFNSINTVIIGGGNVNKTLENKLLSCSNNIYSTYGMTETASHIALRNISAGYEYFETLSGINISVDSRQCLTIKGDITNNQSYTTNDMVEILGPTKFKWIGRHDNVINTGGIKINAESLEEKINQIFQSHKIEREFFITGKDNDKLGQQVTLVIQGMDEIEDLLSVFKSQLDKYEVPKEIIYKSEFILTPTGKINKQATLGQ